MTLRTGQTMVHPCPVTGNEVPDDTQETRKGLMNKIRIKYVCGNNLIDIT